MFTQILNPADRGGADLRFLWVAYKAISALRDELFLISPEAYWSRIDEITASVRASPPSDYDYLKTLDISQSLVDRLLKFSVVWPYDQLDADPKLMQAQLLGQHFPSVVEQITSAINERGGAEALLAWANCETLSQVALQMALPIIYNEVGPLRPPQYKATAYFDFSGVGKSTQALIRWEQFVAEQNEIQVHDLPSLRDIFSFRREGKFSGSRKYAVGVSLQDNEQEVLGGFTNETIMNIVTSKFDGPILVRTHPAQTNLPDGLCCDVDTSVSSSEFLTKIDSLVTVNSGIGFEAMLQSVPVYALGEPPYKFNTWSLETKKPLNDPSSSLMWMNWFSFCYLIPFNLLFNAPYYRWRISGPTEREIYEKHYSLWTGEKLKSSE
jgi:hypothetical protein